jgi:hypothetical protein
MKHICLSILAYLSKSSREKVRSKEKVKSNVCILGTRKTYSFAILNRDINSPCNIPKYNRAYGKTQKTENKKESIIL